MRCVLCSEDLKNQKEQQEHTQTSHQDQENCSNRHRNWEQKKAFVRNTEDSVNQARVKLYKSLEVIKLANRAHRAMAVPPCLPADGYVKAALIPTQLRWSNHNQTTIFSAASRDADGPPSTKVGDTLRGRKGDSPGRRTSDPPGGRTDNPPSKRTGDPPGRRRGNPQLFKYLRRSYINTRRQQRRIEKTRGRKPVSGARIKRSGVLGKHHRATIASSKEQSAHTGVKIASSGRIERHSPARILGLHCHLGVRIKRTLFGQ